MLRHSMVFRLRVRGGRAVAGNHATRFSAALRTLIALAALLGAGQVRAQNVIQNPNFDTDLTPWLAYLSATPDPTGAGAAPVWVASPDVNGGLSGSALIDISTSPTMPDATNAASGISQCIDFHTTPVAVDFVDYGMSFLIPTTTTTDGGVNATVEVRLFADADCANFITGGSQGRTFLPGLASDTTWYTAIDDNFVPPTVGVMVASAEIRGYLRETGATLAQADYKANVDRFFLRFNTTTPVRLQDFSVE